MTVYLGIASFIYILEALEKRYYMPNNRSVVVSAIKRGSQTFSFAEYSRSPTDCGFIKTNMGVLEDIFDYSELSKVLTTTDGVSLNCLHP